MAARALGALDHPRGPIMAKKKSEPPDDDQAKPSSTGRPAIGRPINVRISDEMMAEMEYAARIMNETLSGLVRLIITEHLHDYVAKARRLEQARKEAK